MALFVAEPLLQTITKPGDKQAAARAIEHLNDRLVAMEHAVRGFQTFFEKAGGMPKAQIKEEADRLWRHCVVVLDAIDDYVTPTDKILESMGKYKEDQLVEYLRRHKNAAE